MPPITSLWKGQPDLVGLQLTLQPSQSFTLPSNYTYYLHAWFLDQMRQLDPHLSAELHDNQAEKAFTLSSFLGNSTTIDRAIQFTPNNSYHCQITALNKTLCAALKKWQPPANICLRNRSFQISHRQVSLPAITYPTLWNNANITDELSLTFLSPTAFRKNGNHMPLPIPENLFHSYLRRWNIFTRRQFDPNDFLAWVNESVVLLRHNIHSSKAQPGKQGSVTGFLGSIQLGFSSKADRQPEYMQLTHALIAAAPYFSTGHKVTFGLGQTRSGWLNPAISNRVTDRSISVNIPRKSQTLDPISARIAELQPIFLAAKKRQGGERATKAAQMWATIIAHQENGDNLHSIAEKLDLPYDSVKKYSQLARKYLGSIDNP
jgi:CRISPR-associated endoribonuclease Cas6